MITKRGGLLIKLSEEYPTLIRVAGQEVKVYLSMNKDGQYRARFIANEEIEVIGPHRVKKALSRVKVTQDNTNGI
jgi:hypothetical protein